MIFSSMPLLSFLIFTPLLGALCIFAGKKDTQFAEIKARWIALTATLLSLFACIPLYFGFDTQVVGMQFIEQYNWIPAMDIHYALGVDALALAMVVLTAFMGFMIVLSSWRSVKSHVSEYFIVFLLVQSIITGMFCARDAMLFYIFWEAILIPMYLAIALWGGKQRAYASLKFFLYTFAGSTLLLIALLYLGNKAHSFEISHFYTLPLSSMEQNVIFIAFLIAFAIKVPMWPLHTWLPDAHTEAPTGGSIILAALLLKVGTYGFLRFNLPITPDACRVFASTMIFLSLIAIIYVGFIALVQKDMKRLIAYSSISHMGFVVLGCFIGFKMHSAQAIGMGIDGAIVQMVAHGFGSAGLFMGFGMLYDRMKTRQIEDFGGVANTMPALAAFFLIFCMNNVGLPGTSGFVGEFMVLAATIKANFLIASLAALTLIIAAAYTLSMYKQVFYGQVMHQSVKALTDMTYLEKSCAILLVLGVIGLGLYPQFLLNTLSPYTDHLLILMQKTKLS